MTLLKSGQHLRTELDLRVSIEELRARRPSDTWDSYAREKNRRGTARTQTQLDALSPDFEWFFDGLGVYGHRIAMRRLRNVTDPLGRSLRWIGRDLIFLEGGVESDSPIRDLVEPLVSGMGIEGSFGIRLTRPFASEQTSLFQDPLFERTADRIISIFNAGKDVDHPATVLNAVAGLRRRSIAGLRDLSLALAAGGRPTRVRWRQDIVLTLDAREARNVADAMATAEPVEEEVHIHATLIGADLHSGSFHLIENTAEGPKDYRGKAEPAAVARLDGLGLGSELDATLVAIILDSPVLEEPKVSYALREFSPVNQDSLLT